MKNKIIAIIIFIIAVVLYILNRNIKTKNEVISIKTISNKTNSNSAENQNDEKIIIHIDGAVKIPGIVELESYSRIYDAIEMAGGILEDADLSKTNLAQILTDGQKIYIPKIGEESNSEFQDNDNYNNFDENVRININVASARELQNLTGIGESTANAIIEYRNKNGKFNSIEELMNVSGIGENKFEKIKDRISVK